MPIAHTHIFGSKQSKGGEVPLVRVRARTFRIPPVGDLAVIGRLAPVNSEILEKTLRIATIGPFEKIQVRDDTIGAILVRAAILRKVARKTLRQLVLRDIRPLMSKSEVIAVYLQIEVAFSENL